MTNPIWKSAISLLILGAILLGPARAVGAVVVSAGKVEGSVGKEVVVPITVKGAKGENISGMTLQLIFDAKVLTFKSVDKGEVLPNAMLDSSYDEKAEADRAGIGFVCSTKSADVKDMAVVESDGVVLKVIFVVNSTAELGKKSEIKLANCKVIDSTEPPNEISTQLEPGEVTIGGGGFGNIPMLWIYIAAGVGGFLFLLLIIAFSNRRREPSNAPFVHAAPGGGQVPRFTPEGSPFNHTCMKCGGVIQMPATMRGHTFQCGACGTTQVAGS